LRTHSPGSHTVPSGGAHHHMTHAHLHWVWGGGRHAERGGGTRTCIRLPRIHRSSRISISPTSQWLFRTVLQSKEGRGGVHYAPSSPPRLCCLPAIMPSCLAIAASPPHRSHPLISSAALLRHNLAGNASRHGAPPRRILRMAASRIPRAREIECMHTHACASHAHMHARTRTRTHTHAYARIRTHTHRMHACQPCSRGRFCAAQRE